MPQADWYVSWFSTREYLDLYKHRDEEDAKKVLNLIFESVKIARNSTVLDLACGSGRHSLLLAKRGFDVTGIDLSKYLISEARKKHRTSGGRSVKYEVRDMRNFSYPEKFDLIINLFTSFGYFKHDSENRKVIECAASSLKEQGYLVIDYFNPEFLKRNLEPFSISRNARKVFIQIRNINTRLRRVTKDIYFIIREGKKYVFNAYHERIKLYSFADFRRMFRQSGLRIVKVFGSYDGEKFVRKKSPRMIIIGRKL